MRVQAGQRIKGKGWTAVANAMGVDTEKNTDAGYQASDTLTHPLGVSCTRCHFSWRANINKDACEQDGATANYACPLFAVGLSCLGALVSIFLA